MKQPRRARNSTDPSVTATYYVTNSTLLPEVIKSKQDGVISDKLARMIMMIAKRYASRSCFAGYTYRDDMVSDAITNLCQNALKFNPEKSSNPFAFYTTCVHNSFLHYLNQEKKHRRIRDQLLVDIGENPSYSFQEEANHKDHAEFSSEFNELKEQIAEARERMIQVQQQEAVIEETIESEKPTEVEALIAEPSLSLLEFDETNNT